MERPEEQPLSSKGEASRELTQLTLEQWLEAGSPEDVLVRVAGGDDLNDHYQGLLRVPAISILFAGFMDGRGFSHAGKLRQMGYTGKLLAGGDVLADQWVYLHRCGFDELEDGETAASAQNLPGFSESYQADAREEAPLFRRRAKASA